jgi:hypothetical protein
MKQDLSRTRKTEVLVFVETIPISYWQTPADVWESQRASNVSEGQYRWFMFRAQPERDGTGTIVNLYGTDIGHRGPETGGISTGGGKTNA